MRRTEARARILFVGALPPPIHGLSVANEKFVELAGVNHDLRVFDAGGPGDAKALGRFSLAKVMGFLKVYVALGSVAWCDAVYLTPGQTFFGVLKMGPMVWFARALGRPVVLHLHGGALGATYRSLGGLKRWLFRSVVSSATDGIVLTPFLRSNFDGLLARAAVHVVPNFAARSCFGVVRQRVEAFDRDHPLRILYLSNLIPSKGVIVLLEAVKGLLDSGLPVELDLAGHAEPDVGELVRSICSRYPAIRWHGVVTGDSKIGLLQRNHVLCLPTNYPMEGQPICILEAMAAGMGVVTSRHAGIPEIFPEDSAWFVEPTDSTSVLQQIRFILADPEDLNRRAAANRRTAQQRYTEEAFVEGILATLAPRSAFSLPPTRTS